MNQDRAKTIIIDYGMGNVGSILNMLRKIGADAALSTGPEDLWHASRLILPGVGSFDAGMTNLHGQGYLDVLHEQVVQHGIPILGICLGMQLFTQRSEEGAMPGLGWLDAETARFRFPPGEERLKIPHMGWSPIQIRKPSPLFPDPEAERRFYFVHSYHVACRNPDDVLATSTHGIEFTCAVCHDNILGLQFHPEKSHTFGMQVLKRFAEV